MRPTTGFTKSCCKAHRNLWDSGDVGSMIVRFTSLTHSDKRHIFTPRTQDGQGKTAVSRYEMDYFSDRKSGRLGLRDA